MENKKLSKKGDLTELTYNITKLIEEEFKQKAAVMVAFTLQEDWKEVHWCVNIKNEDAIKLFKNTYESFK